MKIKYLIIALLFIADFSFSQVKDSLTKDLNKGWYVGPNISYSAINGYYNDQFGFDNSFRNKQISYAIGVDWLYAFGRRHSLNFGIQYQEARYSYSSFWPVDSIYNPDKIRYSTYRWIGRTLCFPVQMNFCLFKGTVSPYVITGFSPSFFLSSQSRDRKEYANGVKTESRDNYFHPQLGITWQFGFGIDVNLTKSRFRVFVYDSSDGPVLLTAALNGFFNYSIHTGISYYFKTSRR